MGKCRKRAARRAAVGLVAALALAGCPVPPAPPSPIQPKELVPPIADAPEEPPPPAAPEGPSDHWIETFGAYFTPEQRRSYLTTPQDARFDQFGLLLLDLRLREDLANANQDVLSREDLERFRRLPDAVSARAFVEECRRRAERRSVPEDDVPPDEPRREEKPGEAKPRQEKPAKAVPARPTSPSKTAADARG